MNNTSRGKKLVKKKDPVSKLAMPGAVMPLVAIICIYVFWAFAIFFGIV